ncbi:hypothetical protein [Longimicrobium sp.]|uniref:hypothetical protein n=1 Tax=Longimicrobium sp. TaxID=2029185 RepID=UPI002B722F2A|nr:hypothetical protein [Longimicrobium sp.]HSU14840.1 hypothetical protein [Longimicrobium sp.]
MEPTPVYIYRVSVDGEMRDYVSVLAPGVVQRAGLPAASIVGGFTERTVEGEPVPASFAGNPAFVEVLSRVVARHGPDEPALRDEARRVGSGYVYVIDGRTPDPSAPMQAEDVIGAFQVRGGGVVREPYLPNPKHQLFTDNGFFRLSDELHRRLVEEIAKAGGNA